jgi:hypothetical protein
MVIPDPPSLRRAVWLGVVRTGFAAAAWLVVAALLVVLGGIGLAAARGGHFGDVSRYAVLVGHPEYRSDDGDCCAGLGYTLRRDLELTARGTFGGTATVTGVVRLGVTGSVTAELPPATGTPIGDARKRGRPAKGATTAFLATLPPSATASAIVEFDGPRPADDALFGDQVFLSPPYDEPVATWAVTDLRGFTQWVGKLGPGDDDMLGELGAPTLEQLRALAADPRITGVILEHATVPELRALLASPRVLSVNVAAAGFDPAQQFPIS